MNRYLLVLKNRNFVLVTIADAVSVLGDQIGWIALLWFATVTTKSPEMVGLMGLAYGLPSVFLGAVVGNILDKTSQKMLLFMANVLLGAAFLTIPVLQHTHGLSSTTLLLMVLIAGCLTPFTTIGWMIIVPNLVHEEDLGLANSTVETVWHGASLLGPMVGGVLIAKLGSTTAVFADAISFWVAAGCLLFLKNQPTSKSNGSSSQARGPVGFIRDTWDGFKVLYNLKPVWWITIGALMLNLAYGQLEVSLPLFTHRELAGSAVVLGALWTTYFIASLVGSALSGLMSNKGHTGLWMSCMAILWGLSFVPLIWVHTLWVAYISMTCGGFLFSGYPPLARTSVQRIVPKEYHGRILGIRGALIAIGMPAGSYLSGELGLWLVPSRVIGLTGVMVMLVGLLFLFIRDFRTI